MKIKVCGMREPGNLADIAVHRPDFIGLIFWPKSPRFVEDCPAQMWDGLPDGMKRVGVFVNADRAYIRRQTVRYRLDLVQLHGDETPDFCEAVSRDCPVIKAFGVETEEDLIWTLQYEGTCDYFLFDAKTTQRGGAGVKFDHTVLGTYPGGTPYFLSGGIGPEDAAAIKDFNDDRCVAVDVNSRFEISPAVKNAELMGQFIQEMRNK